MNLLAIDPGYLMSAFVVMDTVTYKPIEIGKVENDALFEVIHRHTGPVAIERIASYGMAVGREVFETCVWIGRYEQVCRDGGVIPGKVYRQDAKINLCRQTKAKDANIRQALLDRFGVVGTKKNPGWFYGFAADIWAAYAVGVTWLDTHPR